MKTYSELLKDPRWQRKRLEMLSAADWKCSACGSGETTLHVHHLKYRKGAAPWEYDNSELSVRCERCHLDSHTYLERLKATTALLPAAELLRIVGYAETITSLWQQGLSETIADPPVRQGIADALHVAIEKINEVMDRNE